MAENKNKKERLLTYADIFETEEFPLFKNDKERIKYVKEAYKNIPLAKAMSIYYGIEIAPEVKQNRSINQIINIDLGQILVGTVKELTKQRIIFDVPGVKEEIVCKENFASCEDNVQNYLLNHNNKLPFEVREKQGNTYYVSVIGAMYKQWTDAINKAIQKEDGIEVHIDSLVQGGYLCHTPITTLNNLTGRNYTHSVFIPGSHIVLNIEHDFEKWIGEDVDMIPQKFVDFKTIGYGPNKLIEKSLVGSRKLVLQNLGNKNLYDMYNDLQMKMKLIESGKNVNIESTIYDGIVTGIINSNNKTGIFIELNDKYITGLMPIDASDLLDYKPGDPVKVKISEFEVQEGRDPFIYNKKGILLKSNVRPVFELA